MTTLQEAAQYRSLYELTGDIKDFNTMLVPRTALAQQGEPIYQYKRADGAWIDQTKASYDYNQKYCPDATVRIVYTAAPASQPAQGGAIQRDEVGRLRWGDGQAMGHQRPHKGAQ